MSVKKTTLQIGDKSIDLQIGRFAQQATSAVVATMGETVVHATVVMSKTRDDIDWFPLQVEYQEKLYAGGKIKGSRWVKRDGRPSDEVILKARLIDRSIRPLFPEGFKNEIQIIVTVLSADGENDADIPAMFAVSTALAVSKIPWDGPVGALRIGYDRDQDKLLLNPTYEQRETSDLDLVISGSKEAIVMLEAGANEVSEEKMLEAFSTAADTISQAMTDLSKFVKEVGEKKIDFTPVGVDQELLNKVKTDAGDNINKFVKAWAKLEDFDKDGLIADLFKKYEEAYTKKDLDAAIYELMKKEARRLTSQEGARPDGRALDEIRPLSSEVGLLPRTHGSAVFQRGSTQALTITTLGSPSLNQLIESMEGEEEKRYIHHYNMPPFSVGEAGRIGWPSRREVGHGALAERALEPMIPSEEDFPYTIHVVSEIMSSNGSTSMASVCGSTLSLMDAGVPIKKPVSGIAMGLIKEGDDYIVLSDIQGLEDFTGDMDFKVAGTAEGITAMQMDTKISGIPMDVLTKALEQAKKGRLHILDSMLSTLAEPRSSLSQYAPKIVTVKIPVDKIGELIGPGGKMIKSIIADSGAEVDVDDDGNVFISSTSEEAIAKAREMVEGIIKVVEIGQEYDGEVVRLESYGAFVKLTPTKDGLVHVSQMATGYVENAESVVKMGDIVHVTVLDIDPQGKVKLTMLSPQEAAQKNTGPQGGGPRRFQGPGSPRGGSGGPHGGRRDFNRRDSRPPRR